MTAVDYLSFTFNEFDLHQCWRNATKHKDSIINGRRLENASWRKFFQMKFDLKTVDPAILNCPIESIPEAPNNQPLANFDVCWLYGPFHTYEPLPVLQAAAALQAECDNGPDCKNGPNCGGNRGLKSVLKKRQMPDDFIQNMRDALMRTRASSDPDLSNSSSKREREGRGSGGKRDDFLHLSGHMIHKPSPTLAAAAGGGQPASILHTHNTNTTLHGTPAAAIAASGQIAPSAVPISADIHPSSSSAFSSASTPRQGGLQRTSHFDKIATDIAAAPSLDLLTNRSTSPTTSVKHLRFAEEVQQRLILDVDDDDEGAGAGDLGEKVSPSAGGVTEDSATSSIHAPPHHTRFSLDDFEDAEEGYSSSQDHGDDEGDEDGEYDLRNDFGNKSDSAQNWMMDEFSRVVGRVKREEEEDDEDQYAGALFLRPVRSTSPALPALGPTTTLPLPPAPLKSDISTNNNNNNNQDDVDGGFMDADGGFGIGSFGLKRTSSMERNLHKYAEIIETPPANSTNSTIFSSSSSASAHNSAQVTSPTTLINNNNNNYKSSLLSKSPSSSSLSSFAQAASLGATTGTATSTAVSGLGLGTTITTTTTTTTISSPFVGFNNDSNLSRSFDTTTARDTMVPSSSSLVDTGGVVGSGSHGISTSPGASVDVADGVVKGVVNKVAAGDNDNDGVPEKFEGREEYGIVDRVSDLVSNAVDIMRWAKGHLVFD
ncbi:hypothetical protein HDU76_012592 [Blyttiomyces sp. JEL0837]|nr:hypothetical protein HDU76_012592 [Blyttiomyces sp. JEL0837]